jgi:hypothetical protein
MVSISSADLLDQPHHGYAGLHISTLDHTIGHSAMSSTLNGLVTTRTVTMTGMKDEILLLSWLIVLLRTREGGQISFDWAYKHPANDSTDEPVRSRLTEDEVLPKLQDTVRQSAAAIASHIASAPSSQQHTVESGPVSLLLSTGPLSQSSSEVQDEVRILATSARM